MPQQKQQPQQAQQQVQKQPSAIRRRMGIAFRQPFVIAGLVATAASAFVMPQLFVPLAALFAVTPVMTAVFPGAARMVYNVLDGARSLSARALRGAWRMSTAPLRSLGRAMVSPLKGGTSRSSGRSRTGRDGNGHMSVPTTRKEQAKARAFDERHGRESKDAVVQQLVDRLRDSGLRVNTDWDAAMKELKASPDWKHFRTKPIIYGFVYKGVIHINTEKSSLQTPIHEYTHVWAEVMRQRNPDEWDHIVDLMQQDKKLWNHIKKGYPHLTSPDEIADEVLATYSGRQGAECLKEMGKAVGSGTMLDKMFEALDRFWKAVGEFFDIHYDSREEIADRVLYDMLNGVNPIEMLQDGQSWNDNHPQHQLDDTVRASAADRSEEHPQEDKVNVQDIEQKEDQDQDEDRQETVSQNEEKAAFLVLQDFIRLSDEGIRPTAVCLVIDKPVDVPGTGQVRGLCVFDDRQLSSPLLLVSGEGGLKAVPASSVTGKDFDGIAAAVGKGSLCATFTDVSDGRRFMDFYRPGIHSLERYPVDALQRQLASEYRISEDSLNPGSFVAVDRIDRSLSSSMQFIVENASRLLSRGTLVGRDNGDLVVELEGVPGQKDVTGMVSADIASAKFLAGKLHGRFEDYGDVRSVIFPYSSERDNAADAARFMDCYKNWPGKALNVISDRTAFGGLKDGNGYRPMSDVERLKLQNFLRAYESIPAFRDGWYGSRMAAVLDDGFAARHGLDGLETFGALRRDLQDIHADAVLSVLTEGRQRDLFFDGEHTAGRRVLGFRAGHDGEHETYVADDADRVTLQPFCYHHERLLLQNLPELREKYLGQGGGTLPSVGLDEAVATVSSKALSPADGYDSYGRSVLDSFFSQVPREFRHSLAELVGVRADSALAGRIHNEKWLAAAKDDAVAVADGTAREVPRQRGLSV